MQAPLVPSSATLMRSLWRGDKVMNQILIIKTGQTLPSLLSRRGDFEHWILSGMQVDAARVMIVDVHNGAPLPNYGEISGIVITGSHAMVTERQAWSECTAEWLPGAVDRGVPILGICYGHQLLARALGGEVGDNPKGRHFGTVEVALHKNAQGDALLGDFSSPIQVHVGHTQSVLRLPDRAKRLAYSDMDPNQAFVVGGSAWGVQFHPEFDAEIMVEYIDHYRKVLREQDLNPDLLIESCRDTPYGSEILKRFAQLLG